MSVHDYPRKALENSCIECHIIVDSIVRRIRDGEFCMLTGSESRIMRSSYNVDLYLPHGKLHNFDRNTGESMAGDNFRE